MKKADTDFQHQKLLWSLGFEHAVTYSDCTDRHSGSELQWSLVKSKPNNATSRLQLQLPKGPEIIITVLNNDDMTAECDSQ